MLYIVFTSVCTFKLSWILMYLFTWEELSLSSLSDTTSHFVLDMERRIFFVQMFTYRIPLQHHTREMLIQHWSISLQILEDLLVSVSDLVLSVCLRFFITVQQVTKSNYNKNKSCSKERNKWKGTEISKGISRNL